MTLLLRPFRLPAACVAALILASCATVPQGALGTGYDQLNVVDPHRGFSHAYRDYPSMDERFARNGTWHTVSEVQRVQIGQSRTELKRHIGTPKLRTEDDSAWDYDLHLPLDRNNRLVCQYRVYFDADGLVRGTLWRRPQCAELATGQL